MSDETIAVPRALLTELARSASNAEQSALASQAFDLLPASPELRVINFGLLDSFIQGWFDADPESQEISRELREDIAKHFDLPDPVTLVEAAITEWWAADGQPGVDNLRARIRAALEGVTR